MRASDELRDVRFELFETAVPGSLLIHQGGTTVLCAATISTDLPKWMMSKDEPPTQGWVSAEYNMMPASTHSRKKRGPDSRGTEIQRLIGRVLRAGVDMSLIPGFSITCDCDVIKADGGTRTASITGAFAALSLALKEAEKNGILTGEFPIINPVAAVSVGVIDNQCHLDLDYELDVRAETDMNVAMSLDAQSQTLRYIEIQGTAEREPYSREQLNELLALAEKGISELIELQQTFIHQA